ncbi:DNA-binding transcriptional regulator, MerR family [Lentibacillus halodurans]|uniref:DNA-binding transcriptional regulator, MerR family n=1 Tax=Lentibacillus halodurans TaxID=237679 RepID=A0A1I0XZA6_9BACI|nr:MerR family transcriptional regulator [Lentibacillus halodurans]SFB05488.1 DNA-binding transcriptional regulator, MerR family [Lentibacillus halodurans]
MLTVKEVAEKLSIAPSTIRYYDDQGLLPFIQRDKNSYRLFKEDELFWLELIECMRSTGMPIKTLRHVAHLHMQGKETLAERKRIFKEHREKLHKQKQDIDVALGKLEVKMKLLDSL